MSTDGNLDKIMVIVSEELGIGAEGVKIISHGIHNTGNSTIFGDAWYGVKKLDYLRKTEEDPRMRTAILRVINEVYVGV
jgi:hypothetical protein